MKLLRPLKQLMKKKKNLEKGVSIHYPRSVSTRELAKLNKHVVSFDTLSIQLPNNGFPLVKVKKAQVAHIMKGTLAGVHSHVSFRFMLARTQASNRSCDMLLNSQISSFSPLWTCWLMPNVGQTTQVQKWQSVKKLFLL